MYKLVPNICLCCMEKNKIAKLLHTLQKNYGIEYQGFLMHFCTYRMNLIVFSGPKNCVNTQYPIWGYVCHRKQKNGSQIFNSRIGLFSMKQVPATCIVVFSWTTKLKACICVLYTVIHLQFWAYGSWDSLFPISMSPNCKLMSPNHFF